MLPFLNRRWNQNIVTILVVAGLVLVLRLSVNKEKMERKKKANQVKKSQGFTLIELLVVIAILGILATIGLGNFRNAQIRGRDARRKSDLEQIQRALEMFQNDKGTYPEADGGKIKGCGTDRDNPDTACDWGDPWQLGPSDSPTVYIKTLPQDPKQDYCYQSNTAGSYYKLYARLEHAKDKDCLGGDCTPSVTCNSEDYNYGIASANETP